jgi:hypothetical protein
MADQVMDWWGYIELCLGSARSLAYLVSGEDMRYKEMETSLN